MATVDRFQDSDYVNWIKAGQALLCTAEGIYTFCEKPIKNYHVTLHRKFPRQPCSGPCREEAMCKECAKRRGEWKKTVLSQLTPRAIPCWMNTNKSKWETDAWEIAKVFMGPGQEAFRAGATDTDPIGLLQLVLNCQLFTSCISNRQSFDDVKEIRNKMFHSANFKLTNTEMKDHFKTMTTLLEDPTQLKNDGNAKTAVQQLQQIEALPLETNDSRVLQSERTLWKHRIEWISNQQSVVHDEVEEIINFVTESFGEEIGSLKTRLDSAERRTTQSEAVQQQHGHEINRQQVHQRQLQEQQTKQGEDISQLQQQQQDATQEIHQEIKDVQQQHGHEINRQQEHQRQLQEQQTKQGEDISQLQQQQQDATQEIHQEIKDALQKWRSQLKEVQRRSIARYVEKKNEEENTTFLELADIYIDLRMHNNNENYKRLETRTHYDNLQLEMEIEACSKIGVADLFKSERPGLPTPVRSLVVGKAGIGKTMLSMHIADQWLRNELLPDDIHHLFLFHLRNLSGIETCSLEDLFFKYQSGGMASPDTISHFFKHLDAESGHTLVIFDGLDEAGMLPRETEAFAYDRHVAMPRLIASIVNGCTLPSVRLLVTSRPGGVNNYDTYDKKAEIYGFTREKMSDYIVKFSGGNKYLQNSIEDYLDRNVNICSYCYIPVQMNMTCRIVKERMQNETNPQLPETLTELFVGYLTNFLVNRHPNFKDRHMDRKVDMIAELTDAVLCHARMARHGMEQVPIKVTFSKKEIDDFQLQHVTTQCGLMTESREPGIVMFAPAVTPVFYFQHLTLQEFLAAVALVTDVDRVRGMMRRASERQLDLMVLFMAGLLGNTRTHAFLDSLHMKPSVSLDELLQLVIDRERRNEVSIGNAEGRSTAHKASTLLLVMLLYESQHAVLWSDVSHYVLKDGKKMDLQNQHISPTEVHALAYVLPETGITHLNLRDCGITGKVAEHLFIAISQLSQLKLLSLNRNKDLHGPEVMTTLTDCLVKLANLEELGLRGCGLTDEDISRLAQALPALKRLKDLWLQGNSIGDSVALKVTTAAVNLPSLRTLGLANNWLTETGIRSVRRAAGSVPRTSSGSVWFKWFYWLKDLVVGRVYLLGLDWQRPPGEERFHPDDVVYWQRWVTNLQLALFRIERRPVRMSEYVHWVGDSVQTQGWLDDAQKQLHQVLSERDSSASDTLHVHIPNSSVLSTPAVETPSVTPINRDDSLQDTHGNIVVRRGLGQQTARRNVQNIQKCGNLTHDN